MPSTSPSALTSGPPELPRLIAASVWIAPAISKPVSDVIERSVADTTPTDSDCGSPNGEPIAATGEPTRRSRAVPSSQRAQRQAGGVDLQQRDVGVGVVADDPRRHLVAVGERDVDLLRLADRAPLALGHDVGVRRDLAAPVEHEARAEARAAAAARPLAGHHAADRHDAGRVALVDPRRVEVVVAARAAHDLDGRRAVDPRRRPSSPPARGGGRAVVAVVRRRRSRRRERREAGGQQARARASSRQLQRERRAARRRVDVQRAVHPLGELARDRQAEARSPARRRR